MPSRFGLKDFVLIALVLAVGVSIWLAMLQRDRQWDQVQDVRKQLDSLNEHIAELERGTPSRPPAPVAPIRDESWARPGARIEWQSPWTFTSDPNRVPGFRAGGEFTEILEAAPDKITPLLFSSVYGRRVAELVTEPLADFDASTLQLRGILADAWQADPAGAWLRVRLRPEAVFSDGRPVSAEDVRWTFHELLMRPQVKTDRLRAVLGDVIERVSVVDPKTVEFQFKARNYANIEQALTLPVLPSHFYKQFEPDALNKATGLLMGSGPFRLMALDPENQWTPPAPVVLVRNERYWGPRPPLGLIRLKFVSDELARLNEYKAGNADLIAPTAPQLLASDADFTAHNQTLSWINSRCGRSVLIWNCGKRGAAATAFQDRRVRVAMTLLIDREKMIRDIWKGVGAVGTGLFIQGTLGYDPELKPWPCDPARAAQLLKEAGWARDGSTGVLRDTTGKEFAFELTYFAGGEIADRFATFIKDAAAGAGIRCELRRQDFGARGPILDQRDFDAILYGWFPSSPEPDPKQLFHSAAIAAGDNLAQWKSPEADRLIDAARAEMDPGRRQKLWREFQRVLHEDQPVTWIRVAPNLRFVKPEIGNVHTYPTGLSLWEFFRRDSGTLAPPATGSGL